MKLSMLVRISSSPPSSKSGDLQVCTDLVFTKALPLGTIVESVSRYGDSAWSFTAKITAVDRDGWSTPLFLKVCF